MKQKRKSWEDQSVVIWMQKGETYLEAKKRLDDAWKNGTHPAQKQKQG